MGMEKILFQKNTCRPRLEENYVKNPNTEEQAKKQQQQQQKKRGREEMLQRPEDNSERRAERFKAVSIMASRLSE